jgi:hypothetical protein
MSNDAATASARGRESLDLEMELADLRGERDGVPPVRLSLALTRLVKVNGGDGLESAGGGNCTLMLRWSNPTTRPHSNGRLPWRLT